MIKKTKRNCFFFGINNNYRVSKFNARGLSAFYQLYQFVAAVNNRLNIMLQNK